ncbi:hypothetical protein ACTXT7_011787 [Hymenolepis weldensis]
MARKTSTNQHIDDCTLIVYILLRLITLLTDPEKITSQNNSYQTRQIGGGTLTMILFSLSRGQALSLFLTDR